MVDRDYAKGYSQNNKNKFDNVRQETSPINKIVITISVYEDLGTIFSMLNARGASVHYLIDKNGIQHQQHNDYLKTFFAAAGKFQGESTNETGISIMLINDAKSEFSQEQITKLIGLIQELQIKHEIKDIFGLNEVFLSWDRQENKPIFMEAPGSLFPWKALVDAGVMKSIQIPEGISNECIEALSSEAILGLQNSMQKFGYNLPEVNGELDEYTQHFTKVINTNYGYSNNECITEQTLFIANSLAGIDVVATGE